MTSSFKRRRTCHGSMIFPGSMSKPVANKMAKSAAATIDAAPKARAVAFLGVRGTSAGAMTV